MLTGSNCDYSFVYTDTVPTDCQMRLGILVSLYKLLFRNLQRIAKTVVFAAKERIFSVFIIVFFQIWQIFNYSRYSYNIKRLTFG